MTDAASTSFVLYRSEARAGADAPGRAEIVATARRRNAALGLTGYLHYEDGLFYQWLEGPAEAVDAVMESIMGDPRHTDITVLRRGRQAERQFADWQMGFGSTASGVLFDWIAGQDISVRDDNSYGLALLGFMRRCVQGGWAAVGR